MSKLYAVHGQAVVRGRQQKPEKALRLAGAWIPVPGSGGPGLLLCQVSESLPEGLL